MIIRTGEAHEVEHFQLYDVENDGAILVAELDGRVVGFAQADGTTIYFVESDARGAGRALVEHIIDGADYAAADNVQAASVGFWERMGFAPDGRNEYGKPVWTWYPSED